MNDDKLLDDEIKLLDDEIVDIDIGPNTALDKIKVRPFAIVTVLSTKSARFVITCATRITD